MEVDINALNTEGYTPLNRAYLNKDLPLIQYLLNKGAKLDVETSKINNKSMSSFFYKNMVSPTNRKIAMMFHQDKWDLEHSLRFHELVDAVCFDDYESISQLLDGDIDCNMRTWVNGSILAYVNNSNVLSMLIKKGLDVTSSDLRVHGKHLPLDVICSLIKLGYDHKIFLGEKLEHDDSIISARKWYENMMYSRVEKIMSRVPTDCVKLVCKYL